MVARYSSEQYRDSKLELLVHLLSDVDIIISKARAAKQQLPFRGGWGELRALIQAHDQSDVRARKPPPDGDIGPEPADSDSSDNSEDED